MGKGKIVGKKDSLEYAFEPGNIVLCCILIWGAGGGGSTMRVPSSFIEDVQGRPG